MYRFARCPRAAARRVGFASAVLGCVLSLAAAPAAAQDAAPSPAADAAPAATIARAAASTAALAQIALPAPQLLPAAVPEATRRPKSMVPLYVSFASLQALDVHSTARALDRGAVEANPLMKGVAGNALAMSAVKVAGSAGVIYAAEKMWKKNRKAAIVFMIAANAGMALVVQHNYRAAR